MSFKKKHLNRKKIEPAIVDYFGKEISFEKIEKPNNLVIYEFVRSGEDKAQINFHFNVDGTTTIHYKTGKNQSLSLNIAEVVLKTCEIQVFSSNSLYVRAIKEDDLEALIEFLEERGATIIENKKAINRGYQYKLKGEQADQISINYYTNKALQVQGTPGMIFHDTVEILSELLPFKDVITSQLEFYDTEISAGEVLSELENRLPVASAHLDEKIKSVISPSLALPKVRVELSDFSLFAYPSLRGLEGVLRQIFKSQNIIIYREGFGKYFEGTNNSYTFTDVGKQEITSEKHQRVLCKLYNFYNNKRHPLFHMDEFISSSRTLNRTDAQRIIDANLTLIEEAFVELSGS